MRLYKISEKGEFIEIYQLAFRDHEIYVIDDIEEKVVYIWAGINSSERKREHAAEFARQIETEKSGTVRILIMKQNREYGSFLAMMEDLRKGLIPGISSDRRPEMKLLVPDKQVKKEPEIKSKDIHRDESEYPILAWLEQQRQHRKSIPERRMPSEEGRLDIHDQIEEAAYYISLKNFSYDELTWFLAEKIQKVNLGMPSLEEIRQKAEEIFHSSVTYDELCWLNAEVDILLEKSYLEKGKVKFK